MARVEWRVLSIEGRGSSEEWVNTLHRGRVMQKLGMDSVAELVRLCEKADIAPAEYCR